MVSFTPNFNYQSVIDEFFTLKPLQGQHADILRTQVRERAIEIFENPDMRYMPAFKILDLLASMVNTATAISSEPQLRPHEAAALLRSAISENAPLVRQFILDAALERARYEPMMIAETSNQHIPHRDVALRKRWQAMIEAHQNLAPLPTDWANTITDAVEKVIAAECFHAFRQGPLMQLFAEMLQTARQLSVEGASLLQLEKALGAESPLWKRYALKAARYGEKIEERPGTLPSELRIPGIAIPPRIH